MARAKEAARTRGMLEQRLRAVAPALLPDELGGAANQATELTALLSSLATSVARDPEDGRLWLLFTAIAGAFPTPAELEEVRRELVLTDPEAVVAGLLDRTFEAAASAGDWERPLRLATDSTVVDVNFCAKYAHNTGIQRVVREIMPHVVDLATKPVELVAWTTRSGAMRSLSSIERRRVLEWRALSSGAPTTEHSSVDRAAREELVVPWHSRVFMPEVPEPGLCERLACLAEYSGNSVSLIGYDTIPIGSAQLLDSLEAERFAHYLTVVKHSTVVVAISESVAREFRGFVGGLAAQGISGPDVVSVSLATEVPASGLTASRITEETSTTKPLIVCVGSHEPRKNQDAVLFAVERLLAQGGDFRVVFVGGGSRTRTLSFDRRLAHLRAEHGWDIESVRGLGDAELWRLLGDARFSVFVSLHEGYGLPVVESLALGTPVLTSNYGSLAEIAARGGCVTVDPRNDDEILRELEAMLTDDELIARLRLEASKLTGRPWSQYARELCAIAIPGLIS